MSDNLVSQIMKGKYYDNGSVLEAKLGSNPSYAWNAFWVHVIFLRMVCGGLVMAIRLKYGAINGFPSQLHLQFNPHPRGWLVMHGWQNLWTEIFTAGIEA
jgi:hypothetical protein